MHLTRYADYTLRLLIYLGANPEGGTAKGVARAYGISHNHLTKVAHKLATMGYIVTTRGKSGGMRLAMRPEDIRLGQVVQEMEPHFNIVECFQSEGNKCVISDCCLLGSVLARARDAFFAELEGYTLADVLENKEELRLKLAARD